MSGFVWGGYGYWFECCYPGMIGPLVKDGGSIFMYLKRAVISVGMWE